MKRIGLYVVLAVALSSSASAQRLVIDAEVSLPRFARTVVLPGSKPGHVFVVAVSVDGEIFQFPGTQLPSASSGSVGLPAMGTAHDRTIFVIDHSRPGDSGGVGGTGSGG